MTPCHGIYEKRLKKRERTRLLIIVYIHEEKTKEKTKKLKKGSRIGHTQTFNSWLIDWTSLVDHTSRYGRLLLQHKFHHIRRSQEFLSVFIANLKAKLILKRHDELHLVQRVHAQVAHETRLEGDFGVGELVKLFAHIQDALLDGVLGKFGLRGVPPHPMERALDGGGEGEEVDFDSAAGSGQSAHRRRRSQPRRGRGESFWRGDCKPSSLTNWSEHDDWREEWKMVKCAGKKGRKNVQFF